MNPGEFRNKITFQLINEDTEEWNDYYSCSAKVNISSGNEHLGAGAEQSTSSTLFVVRYCKKLNDLHLNTQLYRIKFRGAVYDIQDVDNFMFRKETLKIRAVGKLEC